MRALAAVAFGIALSWSAALAAEPVFPPASRIGLVPPKDMAPSQRFNGFANEERAAAITLFEMPADAYAQVVAGLNREALSQQGLTMTSREEVTLGSRTGVLVSGTMAGPVQARKWVLAVKDAELTALIVAQVAGNEGGYSEAEMRKALTSVSLRGPVPLDTQVAALPFRLGDKAGFRPVRVMAGNSVVLTDGPQDTVKAVEQPLAILAISLSPPPPPGDRRGQLAQAALRSNPVLKDVLIERSDSFRIRGQDWHEIVATATEAESGQAVIVTQTIRFENDRFLRMVGMTRTENRARDLPRFRTIIDNADFSR